MSYSLFWVVIRMNNKEKMIADSISVLRSSQDINEIYVYGFEAVTEIKKIFDIAYQEVYHNLYFIYKKEGKE